MNSQSIKKHLVSAVITFLSTFFGTLSLLLITIPHESWTSAGIGSILAGLFYTAIRAAFKPAFEKLFSPAV